MQYGGWYDNPATGRNQRWFNGVWTDGDEPGKSSGGSSSGGKSGGNQPGFTLPQFSFNYDQAEADALAKLTPYYEQKLKEHNGDVASAKKAIEDEYASGQRYNAFDQENQLGTQAIADTATNQQTQDNLNKRGVLFAEKQSQDQSAAPVSDFAQKNYLTPQATDQDLRRQAIVRAIARKNEAADIQHTRNVDQTNYNDTTYQRDLGQQKEQDVNQNVNNAYTRALTQYQAGPGANVNTYLTGY